MIVFCEINFKTYPSQQPSSHQRLKAPFAKTHFNIKKQQETTLKINITKKNSPKKPKTKR